MLNSQTLEGISSIANFITAYEESHLNRDSHFLSVDCVLCFQTQSFRLLFILKVQNEIVTDIILFFYYF